MANHKSLCFILLKSTCAEGLTRHHKTESLHATRHWSRLPEPARMPPARPMTVPRGSTDVTLTAPERGPDIVRQLHRALAAKPLNQL